MKISFTLLLLIVSPVGTLAQTIDNTFSRFEESDFYNISDPATARRWVSVSVDRGNLLYQPGEQAQFRLKQNIYFSNPQFYSITTVQQSTAAPVEIQFISGKGFFQSFPLTESNTTFQVVTKIKEMNSSWESEVQNETIQLQLSVE